jgi:hypothetical protein
VCTSPAGRRIGRRHELGRDLGRRSKGGIVENSQILVDRSAGRLRWKPLVAFDSLLPVGIGFDQACVDSEAFTTDQPLLDAAT